MITKKMIEWSEPGTPSCASPGIVKIGPTKRQGGRQGSKKEEKRKEGKKGEKKRGRERRREGILLSSSASFILIFVSTAFVLTHRVLDYVTDEWARFTISVTFSRASKSSSMEAPTAIAVTEHTWCHCQVRSLETPKFTSLGPQQRYSGHPAVPAALLHS